MRWTLVLFLVLSVILAVGANDEDDDEDTYGTDDESYGTAAGDDDDTSGSPSAVYVMEHGFLMGEKPEWLPRGTLLLSGAPGRSFEARLSDAQEFVQLRPELPSMMSTAASRSRYYAIRMYSPESPKRVLQASIPAKLLADHFEDWHDILEVSMGASGLPVSLSYRVRHTLGLALFDHTQVHIAEPSKAEGPRVAPGSLDEGGIGPDGQPEQKQGGQSLFRKYWWVIIIVLLLHNVLGGVGEEGGKASSGGGGGGRRAAA